MPRKYFSTDANAFLTEEEDAPLPYIRLLTWSQLRRQKNETSAKCLYVHACLCAQTLQT